MTGLLFSKINNQNLLLVMEPFESENIDSSIKEIPKTETKTTTNIKGDDWLCASCYNKITSDNDRFNYNGTSEFNFSNPQGYYFDIILFKNAEGCKVIGESTMEFTWFPEHSWTYSMCSRCNLHLGWKYFGSNVFFGLIKTRLVKALTIMN